ncbi:methyltransferase family protein [Epilithonimonas zeae]|uniref:Protein-S-isoprenylcysteine O-methyltransferase Ste14 n=1 Tax=Epilithonimonas zeae TaxID=1416779 RepID=A0A1N6IKB9_9FLAO|nr:isoprenylcysteine carboxylmethyltransferase family protein [Epilithonimonas zeae]SIO32429.1 Protein-S-isoprenylcysteine O-methyltransferase Ste14 [Epilithonimonas zeae]
MNIIIFYLLMGAWLFSEVFYKSQMSSNNSDQKGKDKSSLSLLWIVIISSISLSIFVANIHFEDFSLMITTQNWIIYLGLIVLFIGILTRFLIIKSLGKYFTVDVTIREGHQIKKDGIYSVLRHPSYSASLLTFLGLGLFLNNWVALFIAFIPPFLAFLYRIKIEEKALIEQFGQDYIDYKKQTKKLIPFIY